LDWLQPVRQQAAISNTGRALRMMRFILCDGADDKRTKLAIRYQLATASASANLSSANL
jgi:hypothetical protein